MRLILFLLCLGPISLMGQVDVFYDIQYDDIPGVDPNLLSLDVYIPEGNEKKPIAIYTHGGGWCIGDKSNVHEKANMLNALGYVVISINYRLSPFPYELENPDRITYPDHPRDVAKAISFVLDHVDDYNGDIENVFLFGHSAGAHLVATVLTNQSVWPESNHEPKDIKCACIMDTGGFHLESWITENATETDIFINAFTDDPNVWAEASPILNIDENEPLPEILLIYQDNFKRIVANQEFATTIRNTANTEVSEISTAYNHQEINQLLGDYSTSDSEEYTQSFLEWLAPCMSKSTSTLAPESNHEQLVFYNRAGNYIQVTTNQPISIYDYNGNLIQSLQGAYNQSFSISHLPAGIYILRTKNGGYQRIVVV